MCITPCFAAAQPPHLHVLWKRADPTLVCLPLPPHFIVLITLAEVHALAFHCLISGLCDSKSLIDCDLAINPCLLGLLQFPDIHSFIGLGKCLDWNIAQAVINALATACLWSSLTSADIICITSCGQVHRWRKYTEDGASFVSNALL